MKRMKRILYPICALLLAFAVWKLYGIERSTKDTEQLYGDLAQQAKAEQEQQSDAGESDSGTEDGTAAQDGTDTANAWLTKLQEQNDELVGWLRIPGTVIDYPVMQTASDNDYYLTHDFDRKENPHGAPFLDVNCRIGESDNLIIYGHHMKDGTMFQNLMKYKDAEFCRTNSRIEFDTPDEQMQYQVIFVLLLSAEDAEKFPYYKCMDLSYEEIYEGFLKQCSRYAIFQADELPEPGTKLLTLSTCEYSKEDGRLVIVAEKIS